MLLARLVAVVAETNDSIIIDAARSVTASRTSPEDAAVLAAAVLRVATTPEENDDVQKTHDKWAANNRKLFGALGMAMPV